MQWKYVSASGNYQISDTVSGQSVNMFDNCGDLIITLKKIMLPDNSEIDCSSVDCATHTNSLIDQTPVTISSLSDQFSINLAATDSKFEGSNTLTFEARWGS